MSLKPASDEIPIEDLSSTGLLWLINRVVFHPYGMALALLKEEDGSVRTFQVLDGGGEPVHFDDERDDFRRAMMTLENARRYAREGEWE